MKIKVESAKLHIFLCILCLTGYAADVPYYDYSAGIECEFEPHEPQYGGGVVVNPAFDKGLEKWKVYGSGKFELRNRGNNSFIVAYQRTKSDDSFSQSFHFDKELQYTFSAWIQINEGNEMVQAAYKNLAGETKVIGSVVAHSGCWSMLKGGLSVDSSMDADIFFKSKNSSIELFVDNISLQPFTKSQWSSHQKDSIEKFRKRLVKFHITNQDGGKLEGVEISIEEKRPQFAIGCGTAETILSYKGYQEWFTRRFTATTFDNEMKWYYTEREQGKENYTVPDAMVKFFKEHGISIRGHNILWDNPEMNQEWVRALSVDKLKKEATRRVNSVVSRYSRDVIAWDVMNENMHFHFYEDKLGPNASAMFYQMAQDLDPKNNTMFLNEFNTLEYLEDVDANPSRYLQKIKQIRSFPGNENLALGIGLQGHFSKPIIPFVRASLDIFLQTKLPVWITELDVRPDPNQAVYLEELMRETFSHPAVEGIIIWSGWKPTGCSAMCLTDNTFKNLPAGDVVDKLLQEWKTTNLKGNTDKNGIYEHSLFHGEYLVTINSETTKNVTKEITVTKDESDDPLHVQIII